jgi:hypothetical protein
VRLIELVLLALALPFGCVIQALALFTVPHLFQATVSHAAAACWRTPAYVTILLAVPLTALVTFYSYAYLIVPWHDTFAAEEAPYPSELTPITYLLALAAQDPETMFAAAYASAVSGRLRPKTVIWFSLGLAVVAGGTSGGNGVACQNWPSVFPPPEATDREAYQCARKVSGAPLK